ncbi:phage tail tip lysozyme [Paractinoplanes globisporus]|uniref:Phage tail tip lysozyme n=1 Tax=Paractinoplanes globisporus TaxID=113565 RepID=A0ABW6WLQ0_9ACTN|nr:phage tail tip lysozyme [Actinoplanes globisporus]
MSAASATTLDRYEIDQHVQPGRLVVDRVALLARHQGTPPDLVIRWGPMPVRATVDVVVHLHGFFERGRAMNLVRDMVPRSGLDLADPDRPHVVGRRSPTLLVLPRGHFYGGGKGRGYAFPALRPRGALDALVDEALRRFNEATGARATRGRLILTAHSGGGAALMDVLRYADPDEVHAFDALYTDPGPLIEWARRHKTAGRGALRVLYRDGERTAVRSRRVATALGPPTRRFRVEPTTVEHLVIPRAYGWRLLADPGADLPGVTASRGVQHEIGGGAGSLPEAIVRVAREQWRRWRPGGGSPLTETMPAATALLREYYQVGVQMTVPDAQLRDPKWHQSHYWSAVFVSYVMRRAAAPGFVFSAAHWKYIAAARRNRMRGDTSSPFWAYKATEIAPRRGDLVCASRDRTRPTYDTVEGKPAHCDIVVDVQPGSIRVIGGNVGMPGSGNLGLTVGEKTLRTLPDGRLDLTGRQSRFFAVVSCTGRRPVLAEAPVATPPAGTDARAVRVMELLVRRYGYPVNGATGLVGNLVAESGVIPERIEGSASATPLRAADFAGRVRSFTPDEVRARDFRLKRGPKLPGVGIAQWTTAARRAGLFQHTYQGRRPGSAILSDLEAQVDYLVTELRRDYRQVDATLRAPGVTVEQASDVVLLRFEVPAVVVHGRPGDPAVQQVLSRRRAYAANVMNAYRKAHP